MTMKSWDGRFCMESGGAAVLDQVLDNMETSEEFGGSRKIENK
ncbi:MAG: hypothetical protein Q4E24_07425 [bacterium]|nr:hypothetical protein [bacterium]